MGHPPPKSKLVAEIELERGTRGFNHWQLWERTSKSRPPWISLKLISVRRRKHKANFWVGWNTREQRFASVKDYMLLETVDPSGKALLRWMRRELTKKFPHVSTVRLVKRAPMRR